MDFPWKLPQGVLHSHPVHQEYISYCLAAIVIIVVLGMLIAYLAVRRKSWLTNAIDTIAMFPYIVPVPSLVLRY